MRDWLRGSQDSSKKYSNGRYMGQTLPTGVPGVFKEKPQGWDPDIGEGMDVATEWQRLTVMPNQMGLAGNSPLGIDWNLPSKVLGSAVHARNTLLQNYP